MRQQLRKYIPVFLIALMVQILAPIGASVAVAIAASDPLAAAEICQDHSVPAPGDQGKQHQTHDANCVLCCVFSGSAALANTPDTIGLVAPYRIDQGVVLHDRTPRLAGSFAGSNARARAPPSIS
jgi:Protein of unknown function (DUF2946)